MFRVSRILFLVLYAALAAAQDSPPPDAQGESIQFAQVTQWSVCQLAAGVV
jgi:hypothetical protein